MKKINTIDRTQTSGKTIKFFCLTCILWIGSFQLAQAQCDLFCKSAVNISVDQTGNVVVTPAMVLQYLPIGCQAGLDLQLYDGNTPINNNLTCADVGTSYTYQVIDLANPNHTCSGTINIVDFVSPTVNCADVFIFCSEPSHPDSIGYPTVSDNCTMLDSSDLVYYDYPYNLSCNTVINGQSLTHQIRRIWVATDDFGLSTTCSQFIYFKKIDLADIIFPLDRDGVQAPKLDCTTGNYYNFSQVGQPTAFGLPINSTGDCELTISYSDIILPACGNSETLLRTWSITDWCSGMNILHTQTIEITDLTAPVITCAQDITFTTDPGSCTASVTIPNPTVTDDCSNFTVSPAPFAAAPVGTFTATYTATDDCGNAASCTVNITVIDNEAPVATCDNTLTINLLTGGIETITPADIDAGSTDNCGIDRIEIRRDNLPFGNTVDFDCSDVNGGIILVDFRVYDLSGNFTDCVTQVTVIDSTPPNIVCPADITVATTATACTATVTLPNPSATGGCSNFTVTTSWTYGTGLGPFTGVPIGTHNVTYTATDNMGNVSSCTMTVTVEDSVPPVPLCENNYTINLLANGTASINPTDIDLGSTDNCAIDSIAIRRDNLPFGNNVDFDCLDLNNGFISVDFRVYDIYGNFADCTTQVTVLDVSPPSVVCPIDQTFNNDVGLCTATVTLPSATATDICDSNVSITPSWTYGTGYGPFAGVPVGTHSVTYTAIDASGNTATCTMMVTVEDNEVPNAICLSIDTISLQANGMAQITAADIDLSSTDNCGIDSILISRDNLPFGNTVDFDCADINNGVVNVDFRVYDSYGNYTDCVTQITVIDNLPPSITCPANGALTTSATDCFATVNLPMPTVTDECSNYVVDASWNFGTGFGPFTNVPVGLYTVNYVVTDDYGNSAGCAISLEVLDYVDPISLCNLNVDVTLDAFGMATLYTADLDLGSTDNCGLDMVQIRRDNLPFGSVVQFDCNDILFGFIDVTVRAFDIYGNFSDCTSQVSVHSYLPPNLTCPSDITQSTISNGSSCGANVTLPNLSIASDPCSNLTVTPSWTFGTGFGPFANVPTGTYPVIYTVSDYAGNTTTCTMNVTIVDQVAPQPVCDNDLTVSLVADGTGRIYAITFDEGSYDNCGIDRFEVRRDSMPYGNYVDFDCADVNNGIVIIDFRVYDINGNVNDCITEVTVYDYIAPDLICPLDKTINCSVDYDDLMATGSPTVFDNCTVDTFYYSDIQNINTNCYTGSINRAWTAEDVNGNTNTCVQNITIQDFSTLNITFPADITVDLCAGTTNPNTTGEPIITGDACRNVLYTYNDQVFNYPTGGCPFILREWSVVDWCVYMPNSSSTTGRYTQTQLIDMTDSAAPVLTCPSNVVEADISNTCTGTTVNIPPVLVTDCDTLITVTNDSPFATMSGADASGFYPHGIHNVTFTATDRCGNMDACTMQITVDSLCGATVASISGNIKTEMGLPVEQTQMDLSMSMTVSTMNNLVGYYDFQNLPITNNYMVTPQKDIVDDNGVSTFDIVLIQQHILGISNLSTPYKMIAADVNASGSITTFDIVQVRQIILYIITAFPDNNSWRFVDANYVFPNPSNPFANPFPESYMNPNLTTPDTGVDFIGIKIGDVNDSAIPNTVMGNAEDRSDYTTLPFLLENKNLQAGETYEIPVRAKDFDAMLGFQFALKFDRQKMELMDIEMGKLDRLSTGSFGWALIDEGIVTSSWDHPLSYSLEDDAVLFSLNIKAKANTSLSEVLQISNRYLTTEAYQQQNDDYQMMDIVLDYETVTEEEETPTIANKDLLVYQNYPNPFVDQTSIGFDLADAANVTLQIFDTNGQLVKAVNKNYPKGYNEITIQRQELNTSTGLLFYQLKTANNKSAVKKMILIR